MHRLTAKEIDFKQISAKLGFKNGDGEGRQELACLYADSRHIGGNARGVAGKKKSYGGKGKGGGMEHVWGVEKDIEVMSRQLESIPGFQLPLALSETLVDLLQARERKVMACYALFRDRIGDIIQRISTGGALALQVGDVVWSYYQIGDSKRKSTYVQQGKVESLPPEKTHTGKSRAFDLEDQDPVVGIVFSGVSQKVPTSWIVDKVDVEVGHVEAAEMVEGILAPLRTHINKLLQDLSSSHSSAPRPHEHATQLGPTMGSGGNEEQRVQAATSRFKTQLQIAEQDAEREAARARRAEQIKGQLEQNYSQLKDQIEMEKKVRVLCICVSDLAWRACMRIREGQQGGNQMGRGKDGVILLRTSNHSPKVRIRVCAILFHLVSCFLCNLSHSFTIKETHSFTRA